MNIAIILLTLLIKLDYDKFSLTESTNLDHLVYDDQKAAHYNVAIFGNLGGYKGRNCGKKINSNYYPTLYLLRQSIDLFRKHIGLKPNRLLHKNSEIGYVFFNTCQNLQRTFYLATNYIRPHWRAESAFWPTDPLNITVKRQRNFKQIPVIAVICCPNSAITEPMSFYFHSLKIPIISHIATSHQLNNRVYHPMLVSLLLDSTATAHAMAKLSREMPWSFIGLIYQNDMYALHLSNQFLNLLMNSWERSKSRMICIGISRGILGKPPTRIFENLMNDTEIRMKEGRVIFLLTNMLNTKKFINVIINRPHLHNKFVLIYGDNYQLYPKHAKYIDGSMQVLFKKFDLQYSRDFGRFSLSTLINKYRRKSWQRVIDDRAYLERLFKCNWKKKATNTRIQKNVLNQMKNRKKTEKNKNIVKKINRKFLSKLKNTRYCEDYVKYRFEDSMKRGGRRFDFSRRVGYVDLALWNFLLAFRDWTIDAAYAQRLRKSFLLSPYKADFGKTFYRYIMSVGDRKRKNYEQRNLKIGGRKLSQYYRNELDYNKKTGIRNSHLYVTQMGILNNKVKKVRIGFYLSKYNALELQWGQTIWVKRGLEIFNKKPVVGRSRNVGLKDFVPPSHCSKRCTKLQRINKIDSDPCCWLCMNCTDDKIINHVNNTCDVCPQFSWPDQIHRNSCHPILPTYFANNRIFVIVTLVFGIYGFCMSIAVMVCFWILRNTKLIKATSLENSMIMLALISLGCLQSVFYAFPPNDLICKCRYVFQTLLFTALYGITFAKTFRIFVIFRASANFKRPRFFVTLWQQLLLWLVIILLQLGIILAIHYTVQITRLEFSQINPLKPIVTKGCEAKKVQVIPPIVYNTLLLSACALCGIVTRNLPDNFRETLCIAICSCTTLIMWIVVLPAYMVLPPSSMRTMLVLTLTQLTSYVYLGCLFVPKLFSIYMDRQQQRRQKAVGGTTKVTTVSTTRAGKMSTA